MQLLGNAEIQNSLKENKMESFVNICFCEWDQCPVL